MTYTVTVTSQGQISIPAVVRRKYRMNKVRKIILEDTGDGVILKPIKDILELRGVFKTAKKATPEEEDRAVAEGIVEDYENSL